MSSKRIGLATETATFSASAILRSLPSRDLTERTLPSSAVIVPRIRTFVWACAEETARKTPKSSTTVWTRFIFHSDGLRCARPQNSFRRRTSVGKQRTVRLSSGNVNRSVRVGLSSAPKSIPKYRSSRARSRPRTRQADAAEALRRSGAAEAVLAARRSRDQAYHLAIRSTRLGQDHAGRQLPGRTRSASPMVSSRRRRCRYSDVRALHAPRRDEVRWKRRS